MSMSEQFDATALAGASASWQGLAAQAVAGTLRIDPSVGDDLKSACDQRLLALDGMLKEARKLDHRAGFGDLPSGRALDDKFARKAASDPQSLVAVLRQHIDVVQQMRAVFQQAVDNYVSQDAGAAQSLASIDLS
jgi:hypothetical protein